MNGKSIRILLSSLAVMLLAVSAQAAIPNTFGVAMNCPVDLNAGSGSGAEVLSTNWVSSNVQGGGGAIQGSWTDGVLTVSIANQTRLSGGSSFWNGGDAGAGTNICKASAKTHYYSQNELITGLDALGWTGVDIYVYGHSGNVEITSTSPGLGYGGTVVTNGAQQTMSYNNALTTYVNGAGGTGNYLKFSNVPCLSSLWVSMQEANWSAIQIVRAEIPIVSVAGTPGSPADWATGTTWDLNPTTPGATHTAYVNTTVNVAAASGAQTVAAVILNNANSDLRIESGASLTATTASVSNGSLTATGALNATTLAVSGGSATIASGSGSTIPTLNATGGTTSVAGGTVTTLNTSATGTGVSGGAVTTANVTGGTASLSGGTIGTVNASAGTTSLATAVTNLNVSGTATVNGGAGGGAATAKLTGGTVNTGSNYLAISNKLALPSGREISVSGGTYGIKGSDLGAGTISNLQLNGGTTIIGAPAGSVSVVDQSAAAMTGTSTVSQSVTVTGGNVLAVEVATYSATDPSTWTMSYGGVPMTRVATQLSANTTRVISAIFTLNNPTAGTATLSGTLTGATVASLDYATFSGVDTGIAAITGGADTTSGTTTSVTLGGISTGSGAFMAHALRSGSATTMTTSATSGTAVSLPTGVNGNVVGAAGVVTGLAPGSTTFTSTAPGSTSSRHPVTVAVFTPTPLLTAAITMSTTTLELASNSTLDLGSAASASFFDLILAAGVTTDKTLHLQGTDSTAVSTLASFFDVTAPNAASVSISGSGTGWADLLVAAPSSWPNYLPGDFNKDGEVGPEDFGILKDNFGVDSLPFGNHESWTLGDANDDGEIGPEDFGLLKDNFGMDGGPTGTYPLKNVPEPTTLALLALGGLLAARKNRRA
ncbi:MAG: PEP-CTERM sorting domain-containing protein [Planctomycetota bacterium]|nr:PEP-CTERM sorting domain-containing protein [Planctomycetota bacterium]